MQPDVSKAATWYIENYTSDIETLEKQLISAGKVRTWALYNGTTEQAERAFAAVEIIKAAYCLLTDEEYETDFSAPALAIIRKYSHQGPQLFVCRKCGQVYPASAFHTNEQTGEQSPYCINCAKEIKRIYEQYAKPTKGYVDRKGAIVCTAA